MKIIRSSKKMQALCRDLIIRKKKIGFVPTMGFLHDGHLSLIKKAKSNANITVASIFVNPTQFGPKEDLKKYPRDEKGDVKKLNEAGVDFVFIPKEDDIYPDGFETYVTLENLSKKLEGEFRPTHFKGVTTVVAKLFHIVQPDFAVFGMKDFQQAVVIKKMVRELSFPTKIIIAPTVREKDGLAMSSRNKHLSDLDRWEAVCLYYSLQTAKEMVRSGIIDAKKIEKEMRAVILATCPKAKIEYIAFTDDSNLEKVKSIKKGTVCSLAVKISNVRLIDNMKL